MGKEKRQKKSSGSARTKAKRIFALLLAVAVVGTNYPAALHAKAAPTAEGGTGSTLSSGTDIEGNGAEGTPIIDGDTIENVPEDITGDDTVPDGAAVPEDGTALAPGDKGSTEVPAEQAEGLQEGIPAAMDQTNATDQLSISVHQVLYKEKGAEEAAVEAKEGGAHTYHVDLSALNAGILETLAIEAEFAIIPAMTEKNIKSGDTFQYAFPADVFKLNDTTEPVPVMNRDGADSNIELKEQIAFYEIKNNVVKVTFTEEIDAEAVSHVLGRIVLPVTLNQEAMNSSTTTDVTFQLQKNDKVDKKCTVTLPKADKNRRRGQ